MSMITFTTTGDLKRTRKFLDSMSKAEFLNVASKFAREGVEALASATPIDSGLTASSWGYRIKRGRSSFSIEWTNSHVDSGVPIAIILQYGHGTGTGGYVQGRDYINPAIKPVFDRIAENVWKAVTSA